MSSRKHDWIGYLSTVIGGPVTLIGLTTFLSDSPAMRKPEERTGQLARASGLTIVGGAMLVVGWRVLSRRDTSSAATSDSSEKSETSEEAGRT